ncbi:MAG TPA: amidase [Candidatus Cybelea sp.]|nr:amidase [Candidatus Cybelea sp.]
MPLPTVMQLAADLAAGRTSSRALVAEALARIENPKGEGARAFLHVDRAGALAAADASDALRARGVVPSPLAGLPVSIKDLFDIAGQRTLAGSKALRDAPVADRDAPAVARLRAAGAVIVGRTNMVEFAYSAIGANPHYGTPGNPADRARVPGGSSSGAGVSVADRMAVVALGTDTGGSIRIPSALCGVTGFKPTQYRVPLDGGVPLSSTLDSFGPLAPSVSCCAIADAILAGEPAEVPDALPLAGLRLAVPKNYVLDAMDETVSRAFSRALTQLAERGARISEIAFDELDELPTVNAAGGFAVAEAFAWHRKLLASRGNEYDPRVSSRIQKGAAMGAADYVDLLHKRADLIRRSARRTAPFDAVAMPTVAIVAPRMDALVRDEDYYRVNALILRNTALGNFLDRCAVSIPIHKGDELPVGLMLMGEHGGDRRLLAAALGVEAALQG